MRKLKKYYDQHKDRIDGLNVAEVDRALPSPLPGFREPRRIKIQYLIGNVEDWTTKLLDTGHGRRDR